MGRTTEESLFAAPRSFADAQDDRKKYVILRK